MKPAQAALSLSAQDVWQRQQSQLPPTILAAIAQAQADRNRVEHEAAQVRATALAYWVAKLPRWLLDAGAEARLVEGSVSATLTLPAMPGLHRIEAELVWEGESARWVCDCWVVRYPRGGVSDSLRSLDDALIAATQYMPAEPFDTDSDDGHQSN